MPDNAMCQCRNAEGMPFLSDTGEEGEAMSHDDLILLQHYAEECGITVEELAEYAVRKYLAEVVGNNARTL